MRDVHPKTKQPINRRRVTIIVSIIVAALLVFGVTMWILIFKKDVQSFKECADAGGIVTESYPERCSISGKTFTNELQSVENSGESYVGLSEEAALSKALSVDRIARVVKRDNQDLPVTMDFSPGRLNLYVQNGKVYMVQVEGEQ